MPTAVLSQPALAGPYRIRSTQRDALVAGAQQLGYRTVCLAPLATSTTDWLAELGLALGFPAHFGTNFDALYDCLCDREVINDSGCVLILSQLQGLGEEGCDTLIAVLQAVSDEWRDQQRVFWALFDAPGLDLDPLPLK